MSNKLQVNEAELSPGSPPVMRSSRVFRSIAVALAVAAHALAAQSPTAIGSIRGTAVDPSGKVAPGVEIIIVDLNRSAQTTRDGWFVFDSITAGVHQLRARRVGYETVSLSLQVLANDVTYADIVMKPLVAELTPVLVQEKTRDTGGAPLEFAQRVASGQGTYFTEADIKKVNPRRMSDMLARVPGLHVLPNGEVFSSRGVVSINTDACAHGIPVYVNRVLVGGGSAGDPTSISDDMSHRKPEWMSPTAASRSIIDGIKPQDIVGVEVYNGPATAPATVPGTTSSCGVILIWTK